MKRQVLQTTTNPDTNKVTTINSLSPEEGGVEMFSITTEEGSTEVFHHLEDATYTYLNLVAGICGWTRQEGEGDLLTLDQHRDPENIL